MAKQAIFIQNGKTIDYTATAAIAVGEVVPMVTIIGVAQTDIANGDTGTLVIDGVFECPAINSVAFAVGDQLYWDDTANQLTKVSTSNTPAGKCTAIKGTTATTAQIKINR